MRDPQPGGDAKPAGVFARLLNALASLYITGILAWTLFSVLWGDRWWWLFVLNAFAAYLLLPALLLPIIAWYTRRRTLIIGFVLALLLFSYRYGELFLPRFTSLPPHGLVITVMSYNILGFNDHPAQVVAAIRAAGADIVTLQELNPEIATAIQTELHTDYPNQMLDPQTGVTGLGVISRFPLQATGMHLDGNWVGTPQVLQVELPDGACTLLHFHPFATNPMSPDEMERTVREREQQARIVAAFVASHPGPLLAPVDFNSGDQSTAYHIVRSVLDDSWREAGWGFGHTFPGADSRGSSRPRILGFLVPMWLIRIDYVFHSRDWIALAARTGPWDGTSDHRPMLVTLARTQR